MRPIHAAFAAMLLLAMPACAQDADERSAVTLADAEAPGPDAAVLGDPAAPIRIVEYASTTCPHCATFHNTLLPHIKDNWIATGQANLALRPLPTAPTALAVAGFLLARCAGPERYFDVLDELFATQEELFARAQEGEALTYFEGVAQIGGLAPEGVEVCLNDETGHAQIEASVASAWENDVAGTPTFLINGALYTSGELHDAASWDAALETALAAAP